MIMIIRIMIIVNHHNNNNNNNKYTYIRLRALLSALRWKKCAGNGKVWPIIIYKHILK